MDKKARIALVSAVILALIMVFGMAVAKRPSGGGRGAKACNDNSDNDGDGYTDWPDDPGCSKKQDNSELDPNVECDDGLDNDGDNDIDYNDAGCSGPTDNDESNCGDSVCEGSEVCDACIADCGHCDSCSETDNGNNKWWFGTTSGYLNDIWYSDDDYCVDADDIMEYYCSGDYEQSSQQSCGTDFYGDNFCWNGSVYRNSTDYYCASGECEIDVTLDLMELCQYGCTAGECDPITDSCSDTDGGYVPETAGTVSGYLNEAWYSDPDYCFNSTFVREHYCVGDIAYNSGYNCYYGNSTTTCSNGACV